MELPMFPTHTFGANGMPTQILMDGKELQGVTDVTVRAGTNGHTNVVIQFNASSALNFVGELIAQVESDDYYDAIFAGIYRIARADAESELDGEDFDKSAFAQAKFVRRLIELAMGDMV
jgi:hypothetical protein